MGNLVTEFCGIRLGGGVNLHEANMSEHGRSEHNGKREAQAGSPCEARVAMCALKSDGCIVVERLL